MILRVRHLLIGVLAAALAACGGGEQEAPASQDASQGTAPPAAEPGTMRPEGATLSVIRSRGRLNCGVHPGLVGFSYTDNQGRWRGFDVDFCRAVAAVVLGDRSKVAYTPLSASERFEALRGGKVDLLARNSTWTLAREAQLGLAFAGITFHDGQGFLAKRALKIDGALSLDKAKICVEAGTTTQLNLADFFKANSMAYEEKAFASAAEALT